MRGSFEIVSTAHEDVLSLPRQISATMADWENVSFIDNHGNKITMANGTAIDGKPLREIHATLTTGQDLTRGFPDDFEHYTVSVGGAAKITEKDLDRLWNCNPTRMEIIVWDRDGKAIDECTYNVAVRLQDKLMLNDTPWKRLQHLAVTLFKNSVHDVEPRIFIQKLFRPNDNNSLQELLFDCNSDLSLIEIGMIKDKSIPSTWMSGPDGSDSLRILYAPQPTK